MRIIICDDPQDLGQRAARDGAGLIRKALADKGEANIILATGASQFETLKNLVREPDLEWQKVTAFHLDEYVGLPISHPASFRKYLKERFADLVPVAAFHYIDGEVDPEAECRRVGDIISRHPIDVAFVGIGENGHIAFNDPPADFETEQPYIVVELDRACRLQQVGEGWFESLEDVPARAISMSVRRIMKSKAVICACPDERKARAVAACLRGPVTPDAPSSILQEHDGAVVYLDPGSASLLESE